MLKEQRANLKLDRALWKEYSSAETNLITVKGECLKFGCVDCRKVTAGLDKVEALRAQWSELPYLRQIGAQLSR